MASSSFSLITKSLLPLEDSNKMITITAFPNFFPKNQGTSRPGDPKPLTLSPRGKSQRDLKKLFIEFNLKKCKRPHARGLEQHYDAIYIQNGKIK